MLKILSQPYPFTEKSIKQIIVQSILEGLFVAFFLIVIQPFGIGNLTFGNKYFFLILYGLVTTICVLVQRIIVFYSFSKYSAQSNWTVIKELASILAIILFITVGNYVLTILLFNQKVNFIGFVSMLFMVFIIGIFPIVFGVMTNYLYHYKKFNKSFDIQEVTKDFTVQKSNNSLNFLAENKKDFLVIESQNLFYVESADNYSTIVYLQNGNLKKELIRSSLTRIENQINQSSIVRCHRSFIVNLEKVQKVTGNAQGYKLHLNFSNLIVPVARKYSELVDNLK